MGSAKDDQIQRDGDYDWARSYLCGLGVLEECEAHEGTFFDGTGDLTLAYKRVNADITSGKIEQREGQTRKDVTDLLKAVYEDNSSLSECPICEKNMRD